VIWQQIDYGIHDRNMIYKFEKNMGHVSNIKPYRIPKWEKLKMKTGILKTCMFVCDFLSINSTFYTLNILFSYICSICLQAIFKRASPNINLDHPNSNLSLSDLETIVPSF